MAHGSRSSVMVTSSENVPTETLRSQARVPPAPAGVHLHSDGISPAMIEHRSALGLTTDSAADEPSRAKMATSFCIAC